MIRTLIASAALATGLVGQAGAVTLVWVDNFSQHDQLLETTMPATSTSPLMSNGLMRTVTLTYASPPPDQDAALAVGPNEESGQLSVSNEVYSAIGTVSWSLPAAFIPTTGVGVAALKFDVVFSDLDVIATLKLGASTLGSQTFGSPGTLSFALDANQNLINTSGGLLSLVFSGPQQYDMTIDNVRFEVSPVPETSTALMMLAGLLAVVSLRRRLAQASERA